MKKRKKRNPKIGPSGPVGGMSEAISEAGGAPPDNLSELLQQHREQKGQDKAVAEKLRNDFAYLAYEKYTDAVAKGKRNADDLLPMAFEDLATCIDRLAGNDVLPENVESYIKAELHHSGKHLRRKDKISLSPPASTIADRKKKGLEPLPEPIRVRHIIQPTRWEPDPQPLTSPLQDPKCSHLVKAEDRKAGVPTRFVRPPVDRTPEDVDNEDSYHILVKTLLDSAETPLEKTIAERQLTGLSGNEIARSLAESQGLKRHEVFDVINTLRGRVWRRLNGENAEHTVLDKIAEWLDQPAPDDAIDLPIPRSRRAPSGFEAARQVNWPMPV